MSGSGSARWAGTNRPSATTVLLPVPAMPLAYQSSRMVSSRLGMRIQCGTGSPPSCAASATTSVHWAPWHPVLYGQRPLREDARGPGHGAVDGRDPGARGTSASDLGQHTALRLEAGLVAAKPFRRHHPEDTSLVERGE